jgi:hypothetical protein
MDQALAGFRQMMSGQATDSLTSTGLQGLGMSKNAANLTDAGISVVGSLGAGIGTAGVRAAQIAATDPLAQGMSTWKILTQWEKGSVALTTEDFSALGGLETSPLAKAQMMAAGVNAAGETFSTSTNFLQEIAIGTKLIGTGLTPIGYLGSGVLGAGAAAAAGAHAHGK